MRKQAGSSRARRPEVSAYHEPYCIPSVNQIFTAGGAGYNDPRTMPRVFPLAPSTRIQTPINRVGAFVTRYQRVGANMIHRGIMWCR